MKLEEKFIKLIDKVILEADKTKDSALISGSSWLVEDCDLVLKNMNTLKRNVQAGNTPKSDGAGLGLTRAFSEWGVSKSLYSAGLELETFYMREYNT